MSNPTSFPATNSAPLTRRQALQTAGAGFGYLALAGMLGNQGAAAKAATGNRNAVAPLAPKPPHFPAQAKRIIFLFMQGAISQMDTWEYKPRVQQDDGKVGPGGGTVTGSKFKFAQTWRNRYLGIGTLSAPGAACR